VAASNLNPGSRHSCDCVSVVVADDCQSRSFLPEKDFRRNANAVCKRRQDIGTAPWLTCTQAAAGREVLLGKEDLPKSATTPLYFFGMAADWQFSKDSGRYCGLKPKGQPRSPLENTGSLMPLDDQIAVWANPLFSVRRTVDLLCRQFEERWSGGDRISIEDFLQHLADSDQLNVDHQPKLLSELIAAEWELRILAGESPQQADYVARFPGHAELIADLTSDKFNPSDYAHTSQSRRVPATGEEFCGYRILKELGRGAMGTVFLAEVPVIGHRVALKILSSHLQDNRIGTARFEQEARLLSRLDHPGIVPLYSYGEAEGVRYLVMKAIDAVSLSHAIEDEQPSSCPTVMTLRTIGSPGRTELLVSMMQQLCEALLAVHQAEVLHRDIKPSNILLTDSGQVFLTDFSLARAAATDLNLTRSDEFVGTLRYSAPECLDGNYSQQADIYSLGLLLFELFSLQTPFGTGSRRELLSRKLSGNIAEMQHAPAGVPDPLLRIFRRMAESRPGVRYQSMREVIEAISDWKNRNTERRWLSRRSFAVVVMVLATGSIIATSWSRYAEKQLAEPAAQPLPQNTVSLETDVPAGSRQKDPISEVVVGTQDVVASPTMGARGHDAAADSLPSETWLTPERVFDLPSQQNANLLSLSADGQHLAVALEGGTLLAGKVDADELSILRRPQSQRILAIDQTRNGHIILMCTQHLTTGNNNDRDIQPEKASCFVEAYVAEDQRWNPLGGPPFSFKTAYPSFVAPERAPEDAAILIADRMWPTIWLPSQRAYQVVSWPAGPRAAIACFGMNGATAMDDGTVILTSLGVTSRTEPYQSQGFLATPALHCQLLKFSPDGKHLVAVGSDVACLISVSDARLTGTFDLSSFKQPVLSFSDNGRFAVFSDSRQARILDLTTPDWNGEPLVFQDDLLLAVMLSQGPTLLIAEKSGRVVRHQWSSGQWIAEGEMQIAGLKAAAFQESPRRLILATEKSKVLTYHLP